MQPVYVMNENEKAIAGFLCVLALLAFGGIWAWRYFLPSEQAQLSAASTSKSTVTSKFKDIEFDLSVLRQTAEKQNPSSEDLTSQGRRLKEAKEALATAASELASIKKTAERLKDSDNVDVRLQAAGYAKFFTEAEPKLSELTSKLDQMEQKLAGQLTAK